MRKPERSIIITEVPAGVGKVLSAAKGTEKGARRALFAVALRLQECADAALCALGAQIVGRLRVPLRRLQCEYESTPSGLKRLIVSLQLKATVGLCYLGLNVQKRVKQRQLRILGVDELLLQIQREFADRGINPALFARLDQIPELLRQINAVADQADHRLRTAYDSVKIHWKKPLSVPAKLDSMANDATGPQGAHSSSDRPHA